jgi:XTP/dITP diphosphohydrolase
MRVVVATRNRGKVQELVRLFAIPELTLLSLDELPAIADVIEDAATFEGNARKKAWETAIAFGLPALADDSGLAVDALDGAPGIHSARFAGEHGNDGGNNDKLLTLMQDVPDTERGARFICVLAFADPTGKLGRDIHCTRGTIEGKVLRTRQGEAGFGYDPILIPNGETQSMAELSIDRKNEFSHRARAATEMRQFLREYLK